MDEDKEPTLASKFTKWFREGLHFLNTAALLMRLGLMLLAKKLKQEKKKKKKNGGFRVVGC
jgi:hypothetical protein